MASFESLRKALLISGWVMAVIAIYNIFICIYITIELNKHTDVIQLYYIKSEYQDITNAFLIILWVSCGIMCAIAICGI